MQLADILIRVPLENYTGMDYSKGAEIIKLGYEAAQSKATVLSKWSVDEATWQQYLARRNARRKTVRCRSSSKPPGPSRYLTGEIEQSLSGYVGKPLDGPKFDKDLTYPDGERTLRERGSTGWWKRTATGTANYRQGEGLQSAEVRPLIIIDGGQFNQVGFILGAGSPSSTSGNSGRNGATMS